MGMGQNYSTGPRVLVLPFTRVPTWIPILDRMEVVRFGLRRPSKLSASSSAKSRAMARPASRNTGGEAVPGKFGRAKELYFLCDLSNQKKAPSKYIYLEPPAAELSADLIGGLFFSRFPKKQPKPKKDADEKKYLPIWAATSTQDQPVKAKFLGLGHVKEPTNNKAPFLPFSSSKLSCKTLSHTLPLLAADSDVLPKHCTGL